MANELTKDQAAYGAFAIVSFLMELPRTYTEHVLLELLEATVKIDPRLRAHPDVGVKATDLVMVTFRHLLSIVEAPDAPAEH